MAKDSTVRDQVSDEEWQVRVDLAACYRTIALYGWDDLVFTHVSARVPVLCTKRGRTLAILHTHTKAGVAVSAQASGLLTTGASIADAFLMMYVLETACQIQIMAQSSGRVCYENSTGRIRHSETKSSG